MAQLREGSVIKKPTGDEIIATKEDINKELENLKIYHVGKTPPSNKNLPWIDTSL